jgi:hypothetical protein
MWSITFSSGKKKPAPPKLELRFAPRPDITTYELALLLPAIYRPFATREGFMSLLSQLPLSCWKHLQPLDEESQKVADELQEKARRQQ